MYTTRKSVCDVILICQVRLLLSLYSFTINLLAASQGPGVGGLEDANMRALGEEGWGSVTCLHIKETMT